MDLGALFGGLGCGDLSQDRTIRGATSLGVESAGQGRLEGAPCAVFGAHRALDLCSRRSALEGESTLPCHHGFRLIESELGSPHALLGEMVRHPPKGDEARTRLRNLRLSLLQSGLGVGGVELYEELAPRDEVALDDDDFQNPRESQAT